MKPRYLFIASSLALALGCTPALQVAQNQPVESVARVTKKEIPAQPTPQPNLAHQATPTPAPDTSNPGAAEFELEAANQGFYEPTVASASKVLSQTEVQEETTDISILEESREDQPQITDPNEEFRRMLEERLAEEQTNTAPASSLSAPMRSSESGPLTLTVTLPTGPQVNLKEEKLIQWEQALANNNQKLLPGWLLQGLEWLTEAPKQEPQRSHTIMPFFRFLKEGGHLNDVNPNDMTRQQVVAKLRVLMDRLQAGEGNFDSIVLFTENTSSLKPSRPTDSREVNAPVSDSGPEGFWQPGYHQNARTRSASPATESQEDPNDKLVLRLMMKEATKEARKSTSPHSRSSEKLPMLTIALSPQKVVVLDENLLVQWEKGMKALAQGERLTTDLPNWLLQGIEWLTHAPTVEPARSQTVMPIYRYMKEAGHLKDVKLDDMTPQQVVQKLRILVNEVKAGTGKYRNLSANPARNQRSQIDTQDAAKPKSKENPQGSPSSPRSLKPYIRSLSVNTPHLGNGLSYQPQRPLFSIPDTAFISQHEKTNDQPTSSLHIPLRPSWKKAYLEKLTRISVRVPYGITSQQSEMTYKVPDVSHALADAANELKSEYPWVPWGEINWDTGDPYRTRNVSTQGQFFIRAGLNLPIIFVEIEGGAGRFSKPFLRPRDVLPPWKIFQSDELTELVTRRVTTPKAQGAVTARIGVDMERIVPDHLLPRLEFGDFALGMDFSAYYLLGADFSYRVGLEIIDPSAVDHLEGLFSRVPLVSANTKRKAAEAIVGHVESGMISYFWPPALSGFGFSGKAYLDIGQRLRIAARYHRERARGIQFKTQDWLFRGPQVRTQFLSIGIETQI